MSGATRRAHERIDVNRPVELAELDDYGAVVGYTRDLSEKGLRARFDITPQTSANVLVRLFLEEGKEPVEKRGKVIWAAPDIYGDGTEVGLRLVAGSDDDDEPEADAGRGPLVPGTFLSVGQGVVVLRAGAELEAVVAEIGQIDEQGRISVMLSVGAEYPTDAAPEVAPDDTAIDADEWKPHPLRDALATARRFAVPAARFLMRVAGVLFAASSRAIQVLWHKLPAGPRASAESFFKRVGRGLSDLRRRLTSAPWYPSKKRKKELRG
jgi:hypothetical protein